MTPVLLRALRPLNLLMVALTQGVCWAWMYFVAAGKGIRLLPLVDAALLVFSTVCITAAGYLINDYYDRAIDARNKPEKALPDMPAAKQKTLQLYGWLNALGLLGALPPAIAGRESYLWSIQVVTVLLLWAYSAHWKRLPVIGNMVVALLTAMSILLVYFYGVMGVYVSDADMQTLERLFFRLLGLSGFAFLLTWMREMVKDIEDLEGDRAEGCRTLPIIWGVPNTVWVTAILSAVVMALLLALGFTARPENPLQYASVLLLLSVLITALFLWTLRLLKSKTVAGFHRQSSRLKLLMLGGLLLLWLY